ncbi:hypothetical protein M569_13308 [Genlisea aurea]|uniref:Uncharacterized protein n=1 Tax=Genlisea aurea TaxID=192259 RepID=S8C4A9_9LAMI|nr:hypothetical protein M569_13308 [Genlisea aurea]
MAASTFNANEIYAKELEDELMKYTRRDDHHKAEIRSVEKFQEVKRQLEEEVQISKETEVNIIDCAKSDPNELVAEEYEENTESSSSFDGSDLALECDSNFPDSEVLSAFHGDSDANMLREKFRSRKNKPTEHWRAYVQPLIWRCKWIELQIKKLESQGRVYENLLDKTKKWSLQHGVIPIDGVKSTPFSHVNGKSNLSKFYMFYLDFETRVFSAENKKPLTDCVPKRNESRNTGKATQTTADVDIDFCEEDELFSTNCDADNADEHLLWKISSLQSQVGLLKTKLSRITSRNVWIFACIDDLSCFSMPSSASTPTAGGDGNERTVDFIVPENSISSHGDATTVPDDADDARLTGAPKKVEVKEEPINEGSGNAEPEKPTEGKKSNKRLRSVRKLPAPSKGRKKRGRRKAAAAGRNIRKSGN